MLGFRALVTGALVTSAGEFSSTPPPVDGDECITIAWGDSWATDIWGEAWGRVCPAEPTPEPEPGETPDEGPGRFLRSINLDSHGPDYNEPRVPLREKSSREKAEDARLAREEAEEKARVAKEKERKILAEIEMLRLQEEQARGRAGIFAEGHQKLSAQAIKLQADLRQAKVEYALAHAERVFRHRKMVEDDEDDAMTMLATMLLH